MDDKTSAPIPEATVIVIQTSSVLGPSQDQVGSPLSTNITGMVSPIIYSNGTYRVSVSAPGYQDLSEEFDIPINACETGLTLTLDLTSISPSPEPCSVDTGIDIAVYDSY